MRLQRLDRHHASSLARAALTLTVSASLSHAADPVFVDVTPALLAAPDASYGVSWADVDGDGDPDLYVSNDNQANNLFRNDAGTFVDVTTGPLGNTGRTRVASWCDIDNDGDLDVYLVNRGPGNRLIRNDDGDFVDVTAPPLDDVGLGYSGSWLDYDGDGRVDFYLGNIGSPDINHLFRNEGGDVFVDVTVPPLDDDEQTRGVAIADYDNDGDLDIYLANRSAGNRLHRNDGGVFVEVTAGPIDDPSPSYGGSWADVENDGDLDLYVTNGGAANRFFRNDGDVFVDITTPALADTALSRSGAWGDFDYDGDLDLYSSNALLTANKLFRNDDGVLVDVTVPPLGDASSGEGAAWADYDGDGDLDLYLANELQPNKLFRNDGETGGWLQVDVVGTVSNRSGVGTRLRAVTGETSQIRDVVPGTSYVSQSFMTQSFGLGTAATVDSLIVTWPSGIVDVHVDLPANQRITVVEGEPLAVPAPPVAIAVALSSRPNPFNPRTTITIRTAAAAPASLRVFDAAGRLVRVLAEDRWIGGGEHAVEWDGVDDAGSAVASGTYVIELRSGPSRAARRIVLVR